MKYKIKDDMLEINIEEEDVKDFFKERKFELLSGMLFKKLMVTVAKDAISEVSPQPTFVQCIFPKDEGESSVDWMERILGRKLA